MAKKKKSWFNLVKRLFIWDTHSTQEKVKTKLIFSLYDSVYSNEKEKLDFRKRKEENGYLES